MTVLITGGTGFVGLALAERLLADGHAVRLFAPGPPAAAFAGARALAGAVCMSGDIRDEAALARALRGVTGVVHLAAVTPNAEAEKTAPAEIVGVNVAGTAALASAMAGHAPGARLVLVSSVAVYGTNEPPGGTYDEALAPAEPQSLYGITKRAAEQVAARLAELCGLDLVTVRLGPVFGPWEHASGARALLSPHGQVLALAAEGRAAVLARPMAADWLYSRDAARGLAALLTAERPAHRLYNLGGGRVTTVEAWCRQATGRIAGLDWRMAGAGEDATVSLTIVRDRAPLAVERIRRDLGFVPDFTLAAAVEDHAGWIAAQADADAHRQGRTH